MARERFGDDELDAMRRCAMALTSLDGEARRRVVDYLRARFSPGVEVCGLGAKTVANFGGNAEDDTGPDVTLAAADSP